ncbi:MAG: D-aminoacyl-tRNA deacylase [Anaerolineae bacterium]
MRALIQRVSGASVQVDGETVGAIGPGLVVLLGVRDGDTEAEAKWLANKILGLRVFEGADGKFDQSLAHVGGALLVISQFTLYGDTRKGRRPSFGAAARPEAAEDLYEWFTEYVRGRGFEVETGVFGAMMDVALVNTGPVTLMLEREARS